MTSNEEKMTKAQLVAEVKALRERVKTLETNPQTSPAKIVQSNTQQKILQVINTIAHEIVSELDMSIVLQRIMNYATDLLEADRGGGIYLHEEETDALCLVGGAGINADRIGITLKVDEGLSGHVFKNETPLIVENYTNWANHTAVLAQAPPSTVMGVPLQFRGRTIGVLSVFANSQIRKFTNVDIHLLETLASYAVIAIHNARLYERTQEELRDRKRAEIALSKNENTALEFQNLLKQLHEINLELAQIDTLDNLYKHAIEVGISKLGFERLGLFRFDVQRNLIIGTYGVGPDGEIRSEQHYQSKVENHQQWIDGLLNNKERITLSETTLYDYDQSIGTGWNAMAALWDGDQIIGYLAIDNLLSKRPMRPYEEELLSLYGKIIGYLITLNETQFALKFSENNALTFQSSLRYLHDISLTLAQTESLDDLYRGAVEVGVSKLGYDRVALFLIDFDKDEIQGTYGTDQNGNIRAEFDYKDTIKRQSRWINKVAKNKEYATLWENVPLRDYTQEIGTGWNAMAALWNGDQMIGYFAVDNLINHRPARPFERELLSLYGKTIGYLVTLKQNAIELRNKEERYRVISDMVSDYAFCYQVNPDESIELIWATIEPFKRISGYDPEEVSSSYTVYHPDDLEQIKIDIQKTIDGEITKGTYRILTKSGDVRWVDLLRRPQWDEKEGRVVAFYGAAQDITDKKLADDRYRIISEMVSDYAYGCKINPDGSWYRTWITENSFNRLTGYNSNADIRNNFSLYHPDDIEQAKADLAKTLRGEPTRAIYRILTKEGEPRWIDLHRRPQWDEKHERVIAFYGAAKDITEKKRAEETSIKFKAEQARIEGLQNFITAVSHDLRTPLSVISASIYLLDQSLKDPAQKDRVATLNKQVKHLSVLLEDMFFMSQLDLRIHHEFESINLKSLLNMVTTRLLTATDNKGQTLHFLDKASHTLIIQADQNDLSQALTKILENAVKYTPEKGAIIVTLEEDKQNAIITIQDTGIGISAEALPKVFNRFYRADEARSTDAGSGMGLAIAHKIITTLKGTITVESIVDKGTTFTIHIPIVK